MDTALGLKVSAWGKIDFPREFSGLGTDGAYA
jgi:hypothetical protein